MYVGGLDGAGDALDREGPIRLVLQRLRLDAAEHRGSPLLIFVGMRLLTDEVFIASAAVSHQSREVALRTGRKKKRTGKSKAFGDQGLQSIDGRVIAIHIIAHLRGRHGGTHFRRRPGHGIAAQVDGVPHGAYDSVSCESSRDFNFK